MRFGWRERYELRGSRIVLRRAGVRVPGLLTFNSKATIPCPNCQKPIGREFALCPLFGTRLQKVCLGCGKPTEEIWVACPYAAKNYVNLLKMINYSGATLCPAHCAASWGEQIPPSGEVYPE